MQLRVCIVPNPWLFTLEVLYMVTFMSGNAESYREDA